MDADLERWKRWTTDLSWRKIVWWPHNDLCRLNMDTINLLCAGGLPGAEKMDIGYCLRTIDEWAKKVKAYTSQMAHVFERDPGKFGNSIGYFKALCLVTVLQRDCGVRYNPAKRDPKAYLDVSDSFIFGIIQGDGGTCASMPVLYCAVGYRLGYPMFLMHTASEDWGHSYVQWDDGEVRFNIEATGEGMATPSDDHYRTGKYYHTPELEEKGRLRQRNNMRHCLAGFLATRAHFWKERKEYQEAVYTMGWAAALSPDNECYLNTAKIFYNEWLREVNAKKPPGFPDIWLTCLEGRRFASTMPKKFELDLCCLEAAECLLKDARHDRDLWEPLRRGQRPLARVPVQVECEVDKDGGKKIRFLFEKKNTANGGAFANV